MQNSTLPNLGYLSQLLIIFSLYRSFHKLTKYSTIEVWNYILSPFYILTKAFIIFPSVALNSCCSPGWVNSKGWPSWPLIWIFSYHSHWTFWILGLNNLYWVIVSKERIYIHGITMHEIKHLLQHNLVSRFSSSDKLLYTIIYPALNFDQITRKIY